MACIEEINSGNSMVDVNSVAVCEADFIAATLSKNGGGTCDSTGCTSAFIGGIGDLEPSFNEGTFGAKLEGGTL